MELANNRLTIAKFFGGLAILVSLFPWVGFNILNTDSQPWPLFFFVIFLATIPKKVITPKNFYILFLIFIIGIFISIFESNNMFSFLTIRAIYNYLAFVIVFIGFYNYLLKFGFPIKIFIIANFIWLAGGLVELYSADLLQSIAPQRTTSGRGVTSFAPEPSFFAVYLFFSSWSILLANEYRLEKNIKLILLFNFVSFFVLAKSAMGILYLLIGFSFIVFYHLFRIQINKRVLKTLIIGILFFVVIALIFFPYLQENRYVDLAIKISSELNPFDIFYLDASMNERLQHIVFSIHGVFLNYMMPGGFDTFIYHHNYLVNFYNNYFWWDQGSVKILSWIGDWIYQLGFFGIIVIWYFFKISEEKTYKNFIERLLLFIILLSAIPVAFPLVAMIFALLTYIKKINYQSI